MTRVDKESFALIIFGILLVAIGLFVNLSENYSLKKENKELKTQLKRKQDLINSQVRMIIDIKDHCDCEWLYDFYLEHAEEAGAYE